ncbi:MAG: lipid-A-disaccharide synthase [bacterium]|nr:lipid-A-disaccharide synthase [bacterium]
MDSSSLFISAGDPSGDNAAARLVASLKKVRPDLTLFGLGGPKLKAHGQELLAEPSDLAVIGFWEVVKRYRFFRELMLRTVREIETRRPKCILLVDYPGFNLRLAKRVKKLGIPIIYYISPQVWAWGKKRIPEIRELVDQMIVILPFEQPFYEQHGIKAEFVGHYLLEDIPADYLASSIPNKKQIALLPGSRPQEVERMLLPMLEAAAMFNAKHGTTATVAAIENGYDYASTVASFQEQGIKVVFNDARRIVYEADLVVTASGTATLETGLIGRPMIIVYKTGLITYEIARRLIKIQSIGLVNLVLGKKVVPELIQHEATPDRIFSEMERLWTDRGEYETIHRNLLTLPSLLHGHGASDRAAKLVANYL